MTIIEMPIGDLIPYANNPRNNSEAVEKVAESIREFGFKNPIIVDKDNVIISGHTRLEAAKRLDLEMVPVVVADLDPESARAFRIADNRTAELAGWDFWKLEEELDEIERDMTVFGFDSRDLDDIEDLLAPTEKFEKKEKDPEQIQCPYCGEWFEP